jgi:EAL domain-containing protein (putative c-di-GMP-specific phosphodiesterase class I)
MSTVGEGIEHLAQDQELRDVGCDYGQGYYFARPLTHAEAEALVLAPDTVLPTVAARSA